VTRLAAIALVALAACSGGGEADGVTITAAQAFDPPTITIGIGGTVTWDNASSEQHTVTAVEDALPPGAGYFASGGAESEDEANAEVSAGFLGPGDSYTHTFDAPGTYRYYCIPHEESGMTGMVVVEKP
jgi:plastocyanin